MKRLPLAVHAVLVLFPALASAATFTILPSTTSNTYPGTVQLQVGGLTNGETVMVQKYLDANATGNIGTTDWLMQQFTLTDGAATMIGGVTNWNVPGDSTGLDGAITARLTLQTTGIEHRFAAKYALRLFSPTGRWGPITNILTLTNPAYAQSFTGKVACSGTNVPNAAVLLFPGSAGGSSPQTGMMANNSGNYTFKCKAGTYTLVPLKPGFVADMGSAAPLTLGSGATVTANLTLLPATRAISGRFVDAGNTNLGLAGVLVFATSSTGRAAMAFTDATGSFSVGVTPGQWNVSFDDQSLPAMGYARMKESTQVDASTGSVAGVTVSFPKATALIYGTVKDAQNRPLAGVSFSPYGNGVPYEANALSDQNGNYCAGVLGGAWDISVSSESPGYANYVFSGGYNLNLSDGQAVQQNFTALVATNHITGYVRNQATEPIAGVDVWCQGTVSGVPYKAHSVRTDDTGNYSFNVASGTWNVAPACDDEPGLIQLGYACVSQQQVVINRNNGVANFVVQPVTALEITTLELPRGVEGELYNQTLTAFGGQPPYNWSLSPGSPPLPAGINVYSDGSLYGYPSATGTFNFSVRVTDWAGRAADQNLSITIQPALVPLQITTASLPNGVVGAAYNAHLEASGGQAPYTWSLAPGSASLPANLSLASDGLISGVTATSGLHQFIARVTDSAFVTIDKTLAIEIHPRPALDSPRWAGNRFEMRLTGATGQNYLIEYSTTLTGWSPLLTTNNLPSETVIIVDPAPSDGQRFYRAAPAP